MNNEERAENARRAVDAYWENQGTESVATMIGDLICDLLHLAAEEPPEEYGIKPPPEFMSPGGPKPHAGSTDPLVILARGANHYLCEIHPESEGGEYPPLEPLREDVDRAVRVFKEFLTEEVEA